MGTAVAAVAALATFALTGWGWLNSRTSHVAFKEPRSLATAGCQTRVDRENVSIRGSGTMRHGEQLWVLVQVPSGRFYLSAGEPTDVIDGDWQQPLKAIGAVDDRGARFQLVAVAANLNATSAFERAWQSQPDENDGAYVEALPAGSVIAAQACVVRT